MSLSLQLRQFQKTHLNIKCRKKKKQQKKEKKKHGHVKISRAFDVLA